MKFFNKKLFFGTIVLFTYISISVFGLVIFTHINENSVADCPYAQDGYAVCQNNFDHINAWHHFSNIVISALVVFISIVSFAILFIFDKKFFSNKIFFFARWIYCLKDRYTHFILKKKIKWLAFFESSPPIGTYSLYY